ncbi:nuclease A inhibitor family protein [Nostoc sp. UCD121]|uniref:nuclease A inhibitor family protein n=1 Tax=unclassified Nostoc TaxID=2593658 RepID=UPI001628EB48|nr:MULTISPECIES: nuclease A inhibitor family protein [unclassified Nostoc]MBC1218672.1 nuclease A inhibitor family protein [Nostoc sp. UCD120]MBC1280245.1 nuclease A inhibitor family protein [Nostoc sp. UCD121]MBC1295131.1 nuclease A inhibitor family protein [Nostoc sp. UCD122]
MSGEIVEKLKEASTGLLMMSESDYPFEVVQWEGAAPATPEKILQLTGSQNLPVEVVELDYLFRNCAFEQEWHNDSQKQDVKRFQTLIQTLKDNLSDIKVYRVGQINIDAYIIGQTKDGDLAGVVTKLVET